MKRLVIVTGIVSLLGVTAGLASADTSGPLPQVPHVPVLHGEQVCVVLAHDQNGKSSDDLCVEL